MSVTVGVYDSHDLALDAIMKMKLEGYPVSSLTLMGLMETYQLDEEMRETPVNPIKPAGLGVGTVVGTTLGVLTGIGIFAIPGVGFLYGAGALIGAIAGFDFGIIGGGMLTLFTSLGVDDSDIAKKYHNALVAGKFLVIAHGNSHEKEIVSGPLEIVGEHEGMKPNAI